MGQAKRQVSRGEARVGSASQVMAGVGTARRVAAGVGAARQVWPAVGATRKTLASLAREGIFPCTVESFVLKCLIVT